MRLLVALAALLGMRFAAASATVEGKDSLLSSSCCLCENCDEVPDSTFDEITVSPFEGEEDVGITCGELDLALLMEFVDDAEEEKCESIQAVYREACCNDGESL